MTLWQAKNALPENQFRIDDRYSGRQTLQVLMEAGKVRLDIVHPNHHDEECKCAGTLCCEPAVCVTIPELLAALQGIGVTPAHVAEVWKLDPFADATPALEVVPD